MKTYLSIVILYLLSFLTPCAFASAQTRQDSIQVAYDKISNLENRLNLQDAQIAKLLQQVDEVTRQNLALKKNLNLSPTIATAKAKDIKTGEIEIMEFRIVEVTGDSTTVHMTMIADNISNESKDLKFFTNQVIDDKGHGYENSLTKERFRMKIEGQSEDLFKNLVTYPVNAPYTIDIYLYEVDPDTQYIKYMTFDVAEGARHYSFSFENLPIKWIH